MSVCVGVCAFASLIWSMHIIFVDMIGEQHLKSGCKWDTVMSGQ